jgi:hypothetical protein
MPASEFQPRSRRVRPYALTSGRTRGRRELHVETLISVPEPAPDYAATLLPESRDLYEQAHRPVSLAELSVQLDVPLGVVRVLVSDLASEGAVFVHPTTGGPTYRHDPDVLERVLDGLNKLSA